MPDPDATLEALASAAILAPSGDNVQPWRFFLEPREGALELWLDEARDPSPINAGQRMSRLACGAALENILRAAQCRGLQAFWEAPGGGALARIRVRASAGISRLAQADEWMVRRCTNRRFYDGRAVPQTVLDALCAACPAEQGVRTQFFTEAAGRARCGEADARATTLLYLQPSLRRAIAGNIRFGSRRGEAPPDGLSRDSLELLAVECHALRLMFESPDWLLRYGGGLWALERHFLKLHRSASGLCLVTAPDDEPQTDLLVGRALQRAWLALTEMGLAAQPMMSVPVLDGVRTFGETALVERIGRARIVALVDQLKAGFGPLCRGRPAALLRFGYAPPPTGRSGRRPLFEVLGAGVGERDAGVGPPLAFSQFMPPGTPSRSGVRR